LAVKAHAVAAYKNEARSKCFLRSPSPNPSALFLEKGISLMHNRIFKLSSIFEVEEASHSLTSTSVTQKLEVELWNEKDVADVIQLYSNWIYPV
jgi:hypothetical protein